MQTLPTWSFSALQTFETCPYRAKLAKIDKIPEPERPAPAKGGEHANDRGSRIHDAGEMFVDGRMAMLAPELRKFAPEFEHLRGLYKQGVVELEQMWCFNRSWIPTEDDIWLRVKLDAFVFLDDDTAAVIDYKSGRKFGNEVKHAQQLQLYQLATFLRYPTLQKVIAELWYLDVDDITSMEFTRFQGLKFYKNFDNRARTMTETQIFKPKANVYNCKFCPYGPEASSNKWVNKNGACLFGV